MFFTAQRLIFLCGAQLSFFVINLKLTNMRKHYKLVKNSPQQLAPWRIQHESNRSFAQQNNFGMTFIQNHSHQIQQRQKWNSFQSKPTRRINSQCKSSLNSRNSNGLSLHGRTLSLIKDYFKKHYTCQNQQFIEKSQTIQKEQERESKIKILFKIKKDNIYRKTSIIDLTQSLNDNITSNKNPNTVHKQHTKDIKSNKVLRIKQELIRNKQRKIIDKRKKSFNDEQLRPQSKSMPMRVKDRKLSSRKLLFPDKNFGNLLSQFLQKI